MSNYHLYHLNRCSGHIDRDEPIDAADDVQAVALASAETHDSAVELWLEGRKVLRLDGVVSQFGQSAPPLLRNLVAG